MKINKSSIKKSISLLKKCECVGIPTETVYGLAANAYSNKAVMKIFKLKKRPTNNPLIVHYYNLDSAKKDCQFNKIFLKFYRKLCPGPITFILKLKEESLISKKVTNNKNTIAIRFPSHPISRYLLKKINFPLAAPSANISTGISPVTKKDVKEEFGNKLKYVLDGGWSKLGLESTIIDLTHKPQVLRLGGLDIDTLNQYLKVNICYNPKINFNYPGKSKLHYSPGIPINLNVKVPKKNSAYLLLKKRKNNNKNFFYLSKNNNLKEAGRNLYKLLRKIKKSNYKLIEVEKIPNIGLGKTINDRLKRASNI